MNHTTTGPCVCAWCLKERGEKPKESDSHGICVPHAQKMEADARERREARAQKRGR